MFDYILKRILSSAILLLGITIVSFFLIHLAPGKPVTFENALNPKISQEALKRIEKIYGLNKPIHVQYLNWLKRCVKMDFGNSLVDDRPVINKILERLPLTVTINIISLALILLIGISIGVRSAIRPGMFFDKIMTGVTFIAISIPGFWLALILMSLLGVNFRLLPISGIKSLDFEYFSTINKFLDIAKHLMLPIFITVFAGFPGITRFMRSGMIDVLNQIYIITAKAKGLPENKILYKHALKNALLPIITLLGLSIPSLVGGSVIIETIFALPGVGKLFFDAVFQRDYSLIMAETVIVAILTFLGNLIADISYAYADPRIRYKK